MTNCKVIDEYIDLVKSGKYRVCREQIQLIKFVENVFENEEIYVMKNSLKSIWLCRNIFLMNFLNGKNFVLHCTIAHTQLPVF